MKSLNVSDIAAMPVDQRLQLIEDLWDSIVEMPDAVEVPEWHRQELDRRLAAYRADPDSGSPWSDVRKRIAG